MAAQDNQPQEHDFRVRDALTLFRDYAGQELERRENSDETFDPALFEQACSLVEGWLAADETEVSR